MYLRKTATCHLQHKLIGFYSRDEKCLQRGTDWVFKYSSLRFVFKGLNRKLLHSLNKQTTAFRKKYHNDTSTFTCSNLPCYHPHTTGYKQAACQCTSRKIATGSYTKTLVSISLLCGYSKPRRGVLSLGIDISCEYMKYEVAVDKRLVWRQAVSAATDEFLVQTSLTLCYEILVKKKTSDVDKFLGMM